MTTKVKPTVEKWEDGFEKELYENGWVVGEQNQEGRVMDTNLMVFPSKRLNVEMQIVHMPLRILERIIRKILSHSVQEAKAETISMIIDRIEMWADDGQIPTTEHITNRLEDLLTSLKQEENR